MGEALQAVPQDLLRLCAEPLSRRSGLRPRLELLSCIYYQSASREKINKEHNEILRLVLDDNFEAAQKLMRAHLECDMLYAIKGYHAYKENL